MAAKVKVPVIPKEYLKNKRLKLIRAFLPVDNEPLDLHTDGDYFFLRVEDALESLINKNHLYDINEEGTLAGLEANKGVIVLVIIKIDSDEIDKETPLNMDGKSVNIRLKDHGFDSKTQDIKITKIKLDVNMETGWRTIAEMEYEKI